MEAKHMKKPVIIAVDDQPFICQTIETMLKLKYEIRTFTAGKDAIDYLSENAADIVLLDYYMPVKTGYEVLLAIRESKFNSKTPVIFITAETNARIKLEMVERGANDYICKPIHALELNRCIEKHLSSNPV